MAGPICETIRMKPQTKAPLADGTSQMFVCSGAEVSNVPDEVQLIPAGQHTTDKGTFLLDDQAVEMVMRSAAAQKNDYVVDYEHQTLGESEAPAGGWITQLINKGPLGLWGKV
ncbi:MAG TPA: phage protease, partial [Elusimicrobiales bacterium]|nr:phage protease [Elusimicrobiales bacterium]